MKNGTQEKLSQPPLYRMQRIHKWLKGRKYSTALEIAMELEVDERTVKRDIEYMRDHFRAPIKFDWKRRGYFYTEDFEFFPVTVMSELELFALLIADKAIAQYRGNPFLKPLRTALKKIMCLLNGNEKSFLQGISSDISFHPFAPEETDMNLFRVLARGLQKRRVLEFDYRNFAQREWRHRRVRPYHFACIDTQWYLIAYDLDRAAMRRFVLTRLKNPVITEEPFVKPKDFDIYEYLKDSFAAMDENGKRYDIEIEFNFRGTDSLRGRVWHSSQQREESPDGGCRLKMRLGSLEEVAGWVLGFGADAKVINPPELRERVRTSALATARMYEPLTGLERAATSDVQQTTSNI